METIRYAQGIAYAWGMNDSGKGYVDPELFATYHVEQPDRSIQTNMMHYRIANDPISNDYLRNAE